MHALQAHDEGSGDRLIVMRRKGRHIGRVRQMGDVRRAGACFLALSLQMTNLRTNVQHRRDFGF